jgi:hypothetical protein
MTQSYPTGGAAGNSTSTLDYLSALWPDPPPEIRVRQLLKHAWRALGLKCVLAEPLPPEGRPGRKADGAPPAPGTTAPDERQSTP